MNVLSLFDGMSCGQIALNNLNIKYDNYFASEIDKYAIKITQKNYPDTIQLGDVRNIKADNLPQIDLLIGGSPCQGFSFAGKQLNFEDSRSKLFFEFVRLKNELKPKWFLLENVRMKQEYQDIISEYMKIEPILINSDRFVYQNRKRLYWTNIPVAELPDRPDWSNEFFQWRRTYMRKNKSGICPTLTANMATGGHNVPLIRDGVPTLQGILESGKVDKETSFCSDANYSKGITPKYYYDKSRRQIVFEGETYRKLTPVECERLQTVPDNYTEGASNTQRYKMLGNGWTIKVIEHIFKGMNKCDT